MVLMMLYADTICSFAVTGLPVGIAVGLGVFIAITVVIIVALMKRKQR